MAAPIKKDFSDGVVWTETIRNWLMMAISLVFVALYGAALVGWLRPVSDITMIARLEPVIFVIIGYYFGRLPAQQNEKSLREEIDRQIRKSDEAQLLKEQAQKEREAMEEKIRNAKAALEREISKCTPDVSPTGSHTLITNNDTSSAVEGRGLLDRSVEIVKRILDS